MNTQRWADRLQVWLPGFINSHKALQALNSEPVAILHGSTTLGIDDEYSDLDVWLLVSSTDLERFDQISDTRFVSFITDAKKGHCNLYTAEEFASRIECCDFPIISELRRAQILHDSQGAAQDMQQWAQSTMPEDVRLLWFRYHYIRMRQAHRTCDNPIERGDAGAIVLALAETMAEAWRAAMMLDWEPYPYIKWLPHLASATPTGRRIASLMNDVLDLLAQGVLRHPGPEALHPLSLKLREIRHVLINAAGAQGVTASWLDDWWLEVERAHQEIRTIRWEKPS